MVASAESPVSTMGGVGWQYLQGYLHPPWVALGGGVCRVTCIHHGWCWVAASVESPASTMGGDGWQHLQSYVHPPFSKQVIIMMLHSVYQVLWMIRWVG